MIYSPMLPSPIHRLDHLSVAWDVDLWAKRDDLIPQYMGGNKVRKNFCILQAAIETGGVPDVIITNGGVESNHGRVVALMGAQLGCTVHLVLHGRGPSDDNAKGNSFFYKNAGAITHYVDSGSIGSTIDAIANKAREEKASVLVIPGGGHSVNGVNAYANAVDELPFEPDYIVLASGTGGTQAGLLKGLSQHPWDTRVIGVSIARMANRGVDEISRLLPDDYPREKIDFRDDFRFGGYERFGDELFKFVKYIVMKEGVPLDCTYTAKAMFGLRELVADRVVEKGSKVVFWHTGGLLNLMSMRF